MKLQRPYLFDAIYRWILDNNLTPYLLVNAGLPDVQVPGHLINDGRIVLNISPEAIADYFQDETHIQFSARFSGKSLNLRVPFSAMIALYSKENAQGMVFPEEDFPVEGETQGEESPKTDLVKKSKPDPEIEEKSTEKPSLKIVK